ncbi:unnamed protein product, partial [Musa hybrid cultivar]
RRPTAAIRSLCRCQPLANHQHHRGVHTLRGRDYYCRPVRLPVDMPGQHWFGSAVHIFAGVEAYRQPPGVPGRESIRCTSVPQSLQLGIPHQRHRQVNADLPFDAC